jgi:hypothetical protein
MWCHWFVYKDWHWHKQSEWVNVCKALGEISCVLWGHLIFMNIHLRKEEGYCLHLFIKCGRDLMPIHIGVRSIFPKE